jgi:heme A synthase
MRLIFRILLIVSAVAAAVVVVAGLALAQTAGVRCGDEVMSPSDRCAPMKTTFSAYQDRGRSYEEMEAVSDELHATQTGWLVAGSVVFVLAATGAVVVWRRDRIPAARAPYRWPEESGVR